MIIGGTHWLIAVGIALSIHLLGMLWLSVPNAARQPVADRISENIVVTLGKDARRAARETESLKPEDIATVTAASPAAVRPSRAADAASSPDVAESEPARTASNPETVDTVRGVEPEAAREASTPETRPADAVAPEVAISEHLADAQSPRVETVTESEANATASVVEVPATVAAPEAEAFVEEARTVRPDESPSNRRVEPVEVSAAEQPDVEVAAARQPSPPEASTSEPDVREAEEPELIDLQELQESGDGTGVAARYAGVLKGWLQKNMHYPRAARLAGQEGKAVVRFVIDRDGNVQSVKLESKSGHPLLDREAREMIERGDPFPGIPEDMPGRQLEVRVPVNFHVRDETMTKEIPPIYLE